MRVPAYRRHGSVSVALVDENDEYRPYDTLKAIGFTKDEAKGFLTNIEQTASAQLPTEPKKTPDIEVKFGVQRSQLRRSRLKKLLLIIWAYAFAIWIYVIVIQFLHPAWIYAPFATWLPVRMDYVGEAAFVASFIIITGISMWNTKRSVYRRPEPEPPAKPQA